MKQVITVLLLCAAMLSMAPVNGQDAIGIKGGINIANLSEFTGRSRISGHGGVFLHHTINRTWCFQPELLFSGEGQRYFSDGEEHTLALDYLQLPLMIQYYPAPNFYLEAGPQVGLLLSARDKVEEFDEFDEEPAINVKQDFSTAQVALAIGAGYKVTDKVILYGRYNFGLTDVSVFDDIVDHSRVGQLGIAIRFHR